MGNLRVGVVSYLLNRPLTRGLSRRPTSGIELVEDVPSRVGAMLLAGELDVALCPMALLAAEYPAAAVVPGIGVGCDGAVMSVRLFHRVPLDEVRTVALDTSSRSGALLARVLLAGRLGLPVEASVVGGGVEAMLREADAAAVIGDPALRAMDGPYDSLDLGEWWKRESGLGYAFAMWAFRTGLGDDDRARLGDLLHASLSLGERELDAIVDEEAAATGLAPALVARYLGEAIRYRLTGAPLAGFALAVEEARALGVLPATARLPEGAAP